MSRALSAAESRAQQWIEAHVERLRPLERVANLAGWEAATTGTEDAIQRSADARTAVRRLYADAAAAAEVRRLLESGEIQEPLLRRQLEVLDLAFTGNLLPDETLNELSAREAALEQIFYSFRAPFEGREVSNNALLEVLRQERDSARRRAAWEASKAVAREIAPRLRELVKARNAAARSLGFKNFYSMELALQEVDESALFGLLDRFRRDTDAAFADLRQEMDRALAERFGIQAADVRPWHWEDFFSQEAPSLGTLDLDRVFRDADLVELARGYFEAVGLPIDDVLARSDLYEREGKDQHAFCTDIDRSGDVRVLCNLRPNERWMGTLLHELGHAAYDKFLPTQLPYLLRSPAHTMATEAIAMYFGRLTRQPEWLARTAGARLEEGERSEIHRQLRTSMLVSARWILVMVYFERELYRDPDREDLNALWWDLVESIQRVTRPEGRDEPDWAAKLHLSVAPVYYHNYLLGELMASQLAARVRSERPAGESAVADPALGAFLRQEFFALGARLPWNELMEETTGHRLTAEHFVADFV